MTHALSFYRPMAPLVLLTHAQLVLYLSTGLWPHLFWLTHAQLAVVTQSCALLYIAAHCDLLLQ